MKKSITYSFIFIALFFLQACTFGNAEITNENAVNEEIDQSLPEFNEPQDQSPQAVKNIPSSSDVTTQQAEVIQKTKKVDFQEHDSSFKFSGDIPENLEVEYINEMQSINIYNPVYERSSDLQESQIFIRQFSANNFLTLQAVNILNREEGKKDGHPTVVYEIEKKTGAPNFPGQPAWRNKKHKLIDIRLSESNPSTFYVFSYNPGFGEEVFDLFIESVTFSESFAGFTDPLDRMAERNIIKPYGIFITPEDSPVTPEKFRGFHTALDLEKIENENPKDISVYAICGGTIERVTTTSGYGGYVVQRCEVHGNTYRILYGHMDINSVGFQSGSLIEQGMRIGFLGEGNTSETDGERTHLHVAIQKNTALDIKGYVQNESALSRWLDPQELLPFIG